MTSGPTMPNLLQHLARQMRATELPAVVEQAMHYHGRFTGQPLDGSLWSTQLRHTVAREREGAATPLHDFPCLIDRTAGAPVSQRLTAIAQAYLERTAYLQPFLHHFGAMAVRLMRAFSHTILANFLRDGFIFWPTQEVLLDPAADENLAFLWYSRQHVAHNLPCEIFQHQGTEVFKACPLDVTRTLLVDVGLYGTLLRHMLDHQRCATSVSVLFFASRSPFIAGWLNMRTCAAWLTTAGQVDSRDSIRLVDTLESLLKPCVLVGEQLSLTDPVSFVCATAFLWSQRRFSQAHAADPALPLDLSLEAVQRSRTAWFVTDPVPCWDQAETFIKSWNHGPLAPMDRLCGLHL